MHLHFLVACAVVRSSYGMRRKHAIGAFLVSAEQKGGKVQQISIYPEQGETCRIALPASMQSGEPTVTGNQGDVTREGEVLVIPTHKGERIIICWP